VGERVFSYFPYKSREKIETFILSASSLATW